MRVELIGYYGSDETHALSAWTSTSRDLDDAKRDRIPDLLKYLATNGHETPFEKSTLHFLLTCDVASHIHLLKHRIGVSVNAESARYRELKDKFYVPADWPEDLQAMLIEDIQHSFNQYHYYLNMLVERGFSRSRAKESARFILPYDNEITQDVAFNFRSFIHFQRLRNDEHAQLEIREIAKSMLALVAETGAFEHSLAAFGLPSYS